MNDFVLALITRISLGVMATEGCLSHTEIFVPDMSVSTTVLLIIAYTILTQSMISLIISGYESHRRGIPDENDI